MVGLIRPANHIDRTRRKVMRIGRLPEVLEGLMVRAVVRHFPPRQVRRLGAAHRLAVLHLRRPESALEPTPGDILRIEQVTDVASAHGEKAALRTGTVVELRIGIADHRALHTDHLIAGFEVLRGRAMGIAGDQNSARRASRVRRWCRRNCRSSRSSARSSTAP